MTPNAIAEALICVSTAIVEVMPPESRRIINSILHSAIREGLIRDDTLMVVEHLVDPLKRQSLPRAAPRLGRSHPRRPLRGGRGAQPCVRNSAA